MKATFIQLTLGLTIALGLLFSGSVFGNAVVISNTALVTQNTTNDTWQVRFNLTWNNSWKDNINFDAVWIFCKYKVGTGPWLHATINTSGMSNGTGTSNNINVACDRKGAFVSRRIQGQGTFTASNMELQWNYGADGVHDTNTVSLNIYGIEMVYVPSGPFTIGDGNGVNSSSSGSFYAVSEHLPYTIDNLMSPDIGAGGNTMFTNSASNPPNRIRIDGDGGLDLNSDGVVDSARFPTGFNAFYLMKYPVTQGQYVDFLNVLTYSQQTNMVNNSTNVLGQNAFNAAVGAVNRYTILVQVAGTSPSLPRVYSTARPDRINIYMNARHQLAYMDWSGLRPYTELEYEKACRGPLPPVSNEGVAGDGNSCCGNSNITLSGTENGTEVWVNPNTTYGAFSWGTSQQVSQGDAGTGPVRAGLAATASTSRGGAYKTYWGIDHMGDVVFPSMVTVDNVAGRSYTGVHGDGLLNTNGYANEQNWPCTNGNTNQATANSALNTSGCSCTNSAAGYYHARVWRVSDRSNFNSPGANDWAGCRGARTAFTSEFGFSTSSGNYLTINNPVNFETSAYPGANYSWSFPSASPSSSTTNPINTTWSTAGTYNVSLQAIAGQCTTSTSVPYVVYTACMPPHSTSWTQDNTTYRRATGGSSWNNLKTLDGITDYYNSPSTSWIDPTGAPTTGNPSWVIYDLTTSRTVSEFRLFSTREDQHYGANPVGDFNLQYGASTSGPWTTVLSARGNGVKAWQVFNFNSVVARYWRVQITSNLPDSWPNSTVINEVLFEGCN